MHIDAIEGYPLPILFVRGWSDSDRDPNITVEMADDRTLAPDFLFRVSRPDVLSAGQSGNEFCGFIAEFRLAGQPAWVLVDGARLAIENATAYGSVEPHYSGLLDTQKILGRGEIYGSGAPLDANPDIVAIAKQLPAPVLDFGCGNGDLIAKLRASGTAAFGMELDREPIRAALKPNASPFVKLYKGGLPLPYGDREFESSLSSEVLEHIEGVEPYAAELARVTRRTLFVTVPDMSSIPLSHGTGTVPWHLLESTHFNFFTARSMTALFKDWFRPIRFFRFSNNEVNGRFIPGSLGVMFERL